MNSKTFAYNTKETNVSFSVRNQEGTGSKDYDQSLTTYLKWIRLL
jgi:hypothetical protein